MGCVSHLRAWNDPCTVTSVLPRALRRPGAGRLTYVLPPERDALPTERDTFKSDRYVVRTVRAGTRPQFSRSREKAWLREAIARRHVPYEAIARRRRHVPYAHHRALGSA